MNSSSKVEIPEYWSVTWAEKNYKVTLPKPFGEVVLSVEQSEDKEVKSITLQSKGKSLIFEDDLLQGLVEISEPDISFNEKIFLKHGSINDFRINFEYGYPVKVDYGEVPGCDTPCMVWSRKVVRFTISEDLRVSRQIFMPNLE